MSLIKICGLRREIDIEYANALKPEFIGFVFAESVRKVSKSWASVLKSQLDPSIKSVGVFVNADLYEILDICQRGIIDMIQLHGDENRDYIRKLRTLTPNPIIKSLRLGASVQQNDIILCAAGFEDNSIETSFQCHSSLSPATADESTESVFPEYTPAMIASTDEQRKTGFQGRTPSVNASDLNLSDSHEADFLLFDTFHGRLRGGSGLSFDWSLIGSVDKPFFLAGGLKMDNITEAIHRLKPYAVDVSSGVETDGYKNFHKMSLLVDKVRSCR